MEMMQKCDMLNKDYSYIDNWYSSPDLFHRLFSAGTNVCGTVCTIRNHMPKELAKEKWKVGEAVAYSSTNITAMKWKDTREVSMLSTKHTLDFAETGKVHRKMQTKIMKPTAVIDYNMKLRGVDGGYQILIMYCIKRLHGNDRMFHVFKQKLAEELLESYFKEDVGKRRSATPEVTLVKTQSVPEFIHHDTLSPEEVQAWVHQGEDLGPLWVKILIKRETSQDTVSLTIPPTTGIHSREISQTLPPLTSLSKAAGTQERHLHTSFSTVTLKSCRHSEENFMMQPPLPSLPKPAGTLEKPSGHSFLYFPSHQMQSLRRNFQTLLPYHRSHRL
ncbi:hypothetical protein PR048_028308 [Dryococelus australis]|uniref:PiggyBac transposable element-derived protein domain-containing protein n=1 Tax=Dryococelus australis TaxID=614101 RepID=A0ABQ9GIX1_9NEOP|nr:hypothetical protein PR048_028308 [Dryococelus australis]